MTPTLRRLAGPTLIRLAVAIISFAALVPVSFAVSQKQKPSVTQFYLGASAQSLIDVLSEEFPDGTGVFYNACMNTKNLAETASSYDVNILVVGRFSKQAYIYELSSDNPLSGYIVPNFAVFEIKDGKVNPETVTAGSGGLGVIAKFWRYADFLLQKPFRFTADYSQVIDVKPKVSCPYDDGLPPGERSKGQTR